MYLCLVVASSPVSDGFSDVWCTLLQMYSAISAEIPLPTDPVNFKADLYKGCVDTEKVFPQ